MARVNLLHIDDSASDSGAIARYLEQHGMAANIRRVEDSAGITQALEQGRWDAILADYTATKVDFQETLDLLRARLPGAPIILVSRGIAQEMAAAVYREGLWAIVLKDNLPGLWLSIKHALRESRDHRARQAAETALRASEARYRSLFENSMDAIFLTSRDGGILAANDEAQRMYGYTEDEFRQIGRAGVVDATDPRLATALAERERTGRFRGEVTQIRKGGVKFAGEVSSRVFEMPDGRTLTSMAVRDISKQKELARELQEREREMGALQKTQVAALTAAAIAHELNQPLLALASYSKAALMLLNARHPDIHKLRDINEKNERQALRAGKSIRDLLAYLSTKDFPTESFDINREIVSVLDRMKSEHELQFHSVLRLEKHLPMVQANRIHVRMALSNLLHNGIEAMKLANVPLPAITVTVRTIKEQNVAQVTIQDNGPGFRKADIARLFEPFFTAKAGGIGMGLAISRSLIEMNGGQLWVDPQEGPGATVHLTLPFAP
jgi:PAS domain S-box-containing protein